MNLRTVNNILLTKNLEYMFKKKTLKLIIELSEY